MFSAVAWLERGESTSTRIRLARYGSGCRQKGHAMVMIGIDPHKGSHTAVVIDRDERVVDQIRVRASNGQTGELCECASGYPDRVWAVESARRWGIRCPSSWWRPGSG